MNCIFVILLSLLLSGCSSLKGILKTSQADFQKIEKNDGSQLWHRVEKFNTQQEALDFFMRRRLDLQRVYETRTDPYFGTALEKECKSNVNISGDIKDVSKGSYYYLRMLENENFALGDCIESNNKYVAIYEFYLCASDVYEVRWHRPFHLKEISLPAFACP